MTDFNGFAKQDKLTIVPESFFSDVLPMIDDLAELKVVLYFIWAVQQREGAYRYLTQGDFASAETLLEGLRNACPDVDPTVTLSDALSRAVKRGVLLCEQIHDVDGDPQTLYFMNTDKGREARQAVADGHYTTDGRVEILPPRPNIYRLYEHEIGPITPMIADGLKDIENDYPSAWLPEAIRVAAEQQAKNLKFIRAVLERWRKEGRTDHEITGRHGPESTDGDGGQRLGGRYADWIDQ